MIKVTNEYIIDPKKIEEALKADSEGIDLEVKKQNLSNQEKIKYSLDGVLNDYYEDEIENLDSKDKDKARFFIEDGLIVGERRVGMTSGVEKENFDIDQSLLNTLINSRLIRAENTHLGLSYEVSHDALVEPILKSKRERKLKEEAERKAAELRKARRRLIGAITLAGVGVGLALISFLFYLRATRAEEEAQKNLDDAIVAKNEATQLLERIRIAQLNGARDRYNSFINSGENYLFKTEFTAAIAQFELAKETINIYVKESDIPGAADSIDNAGAKADSLIEVANSRMGKSSQYSNLISQGDNFVNRGINYYLNAKEVYQKALQLNYYNSGAREKINMINGKLTLAFDEFKKRGDIFFNAKGYADALTSYLNAQKINKGDTHVNQRIAECRRLLN